MAKALTILAAEIWRPAEVYFICLAPGFLSFTPRLQRLRRSRCGQALLRQRGGFYGTCLFTRHLMAARYRKVFFAICLAFSF